MTRYTINLGRARTFSRKKRAQKAMSILREELERREGEVSIDPEINSRIWERGAEKPPSKLEVEIVESDGSRTAVLPDSSRDDRANEEQEAEEVEEKEDDTDEDTGEQEKDESGSDTDYEEIVSGTVSEAKEAISELDDPDYDRLLELEKQGKDRKTLKEFIEQQ